MKPPSKIFIFKDSIRHNNLVPYGNYWSSHSEGKDDYAIEYILAEEKKQLEQRIKNLETVLHEAMKDLDFYARHHHWLNTSAPNFGWESIKKIQEVLNIKQGENK